MTFSFYQANKDVPEFPMSEYLATDMLCFLRHNRLVIPPPLGQANGTVPKLMFNEICAFGFDPADVEKALSSYFCDGYLSMASDPKDREKNQFVQRTAKHRDRVIQIMLQQLDEDRIPTQLGGKMSYFYPFTTLQKLLESDEIQLPMIRAGERKPKPWRKAALDQPSATASTEEQAIELVTKTQMVSKPLIKQVVQACGGNAEMSYLTAVTSVMEYRKGQPRIPKDLVGEKKIENWIREIRENEIKLMRNSGIDVHVYTSERPKEEQPYCYIGYDIWVVKVELEALAWKYATLYFHLQDAEDVALMNPQGEKMYDPPLVVDQHMWKFNLQFKGTYPLVPCYVDMKSKYLSAYGKAATLKFIYNALTNTAYNQYPIFASILYLQNKYYRQELAKSERIVQLTLQKSCLNIKNFEKSEFSGTFASEVQQELGRNAARRRDVPFVPLSPLLFLYKTIEKSIPCEVSTMQNSASESIMVEDVFARYYAHGQKYAHDKSKLQESDHAYERMVASKPQFARHFKKNPELYKKYLAGRDQNQYESFLPHRNQLPVYQHRKELFETIEHSQFTVVTAYTGSGKSSNLPQIIMELSEDCKILVTEPRRISAIALAGRVRQEAGFCANRTIGYSVKGKAEYDDDTIIYYCTIGVIVRKFVNDVSQLRQYSHIIIDEVHERDISTDLFLGMLKNHYQRSQDENLPKIIIMSATVDGEAFGKYFGMENTAFYKLEGRLFKTTTYFLDDLISQQIVQPPRKTETKRQNWFAGESSEQEDSSDALDDFSLNVDAIVRILTRCIYATPQVKGNTLIFLPGQFEIQRVISELQANQTLQHFEILPCHSMVSLHDQQKLFVSGTVNRIICSTNIAEASVTLPNIISVIDTGTERTVKYFPKQRKHVFRTQFISQQSAMYRAGRAGRVCEGIVYCTYLRSTYQNTFEKEKQPEITRASLSNACLQLCLLSESYAADTLRITSQPHIFLYNVLTPPKQSLIQSNLRELLTNHFIELVSAGQQQNKSIDDQLIDPETQIRLTQFGKDTAFLPIEPIYGRILYVANRFDINQSLAKHLVAILSVGQSQVLRSINESCKQIACGSDHLLLLRVFRRFLARKSIKEFDFNQQGLTAMRDTYEELDDQGKFADEELTVPLLQLALWPNVAVFNHQEKALVAVKSSRSALKVHPGSACFSQRARLVFYTEQLITSQNFLTTCSVGSVTALAYSSEVNQANFRYGTASFQGVEYRISGRNAAILLAFISAMKAYGTGYDVYKRLLRLEHAWK